jgi:hypothetical protein
MPEELSSRSPARGNRRPSCKGRFLGPQKVRSKGVIPGLRMADFEARFRPRGDIDSWTAAGPMSAWVKRRLRLGDRTGSALPQERTSATEDAMSALGQDLPWLSVVVCGCLTAGLGYSSGQSSWAGRLVQPFERQLVLPATIANCTSCLREMRMALLSWVASRILHASFRPIR